MSVSEAEFCGEAINLVQAPDFAARAQLASMCAGRKLHTAPQYSLHEGLYSRDPEQHAKYAAVYSPYLVVVSFNNELVGFCHPSLIYLMPEHRGKGLGKELFVQGFLLTGSKTFLEKTAKTRLTYAGLRSLKSAYRALVERGYLS